MLPYQCTAVWYDKPCNQFINNDEGGYCSSCWNKKETFQRAKNMNIPDAWSEEGIAEREKFYKKHGRGWAIFDFYKKYTSLKERPWIEQYNVLDESRPRGKDIYKRREK